MWPVYEWLGDGEGSSRFGAGFELFGGRGGKVRGESGRVGEVEGGERLPPNGKTLPRSFCWLGEWLMRPVRVRGFAERLPPLASLVTGKT